MYWQVYMHKTVLASESLLLKVLRRAKEMAESGVDLYATPSLKFFLNNKIGPADLTGVGLFTPEIVASHFTRLDDTDIMVSAKYWSDHSDRVLSELAGRLIRRDLLSIELDNEPFAEDRIKKFRKLAADRMNLNREQTEYFVFTGSVSNLAYAPGTPQIQILLKNGIISDISEVSDMFDHRLLSERITKYYLCYPKECR